MLSTILSRLFLALLQSLSMVWPFIHTIIKWRREIYPDVYEICGIVRYCDWLVMFKKTIPIAVRSTHSLMRWFKRQNITPHDNKIASLMVMEIDDKLVISGYILLGDASTNPTYSSCFRFNR
jgi:hypothetical protein